MGERKNWCLRGPNIQALSTQASFPGFFQNRISSLAGPFFFASCIFGEATKLNNIGNVQKTKAPATPKGSWRVVES